MPNLLCTPTLFTDREPYDALVNYLDKLDAAEVPEGGRVIAGLGPKVLKALVTARSTSNHVVCEDLPPVLLDILIRPYAARW